MASCEKPCPIKSILHSSGQSLVSQGPQRPVQLQGTYENSTGSSWSKTSSLQSFRTVERPVTSYHPANQPTLVIVLPSDRYCCLPEACLRSFTASFLVIRLPFTESSSPLKH